MLITVGFEKPTPEIMEQWMNWFKSIGDKMENQIGLRNGCEISKDGSLKELDMNLEALTGCLTINVDNMKEAQEIAKNCPAITKTLVYEVMSH